MSTQPESSGEKERMLAHAMSTQPESSGEKERMLAHAMSTQPESFGEKERMLAHAMSTQPESSGEKERMLAHIMSMEFESSMGREGSICAPGFLNLVILKLSELLKFSEHTGDKLSKLLLLHLAVKEIMTNLQLRRKDNVPLNGEGRTISLEEEVAVPLHDLPRKPVKIELTQLVSEEHPRIGQRVFYHGQQGKNDDVELSSMDHGIWDGDAVVHVSDPRCSCSICEAAVTFNKQQKLEKLKRGDHLYAQCENNPCDRPMYHHGIYDGNGYVYHFATSSTSSDVAYEKCEECRVRGVQRRKMLRERGLGPSGIRKSCLFCFSEEDPEIFCVQYGTKWNKRMMRVLNTAIGRVGTRDSVPGDVSTRSGCPPEEVVNKAKSFYDNNSFGTYSTVGMWHNCEAFAYFCKTGVYGAKQITRSLLQLICETRIVSPLVDPILVLGIKAFMHIRGTQKIVHATGRANDANERHPELVPTKLVPSPLYILK